MYIAYSLGKKLVINSRAVWIKALESFYHYKDLVDLFCSFLSVYRNVKIIISTKILDVW